MSQTSQGRNVVPLRGVSAPGRVISGPEPEAGGSNAPLQGQNGGRLSVDRFIREKYWPYLESTVGMEGGLAESSVPRDRSICTAFGAHFISTDIRRLTAEDLDLWWAGLARRMGPASRNKHLVRVRHLLDTAIRWHYLPANPAKHLKKVTEPEGRVRFLEARADGSDPRDLLERAASPSLRPYIVAARYTALRRGNIWEARVRDLNLATGVLHVPKTKNGTSRDVPLRQEVLDALAPIPAAPEAYLFPRIQKESITRAFRNLTRRLGIKDFHFHDLRHDVATRLYAKGADQRMLMEVLGHKDRRMTDRYTHVKPEAVKATLDML